MVLGFSDPVVGEEATARPQAVVAETREVGPLAAPVNVVISHDHARFRAALAQLLAAETQLKLVSPTRDRADIGDLAIQPLPDLGPFNSELSMVQILVFAADVDGNGAEFAGENGRPNLRRDLTAEGIVARLLALYSAGTAVVSPPRTEISKRELVVLVQVAAGLSNKQIGSLLGISQKTVRNHLSRIFGKLGAGNRTEAVMNAMRLGLLSV